jgi:general secretion pathway protein I
MMRSRGFTLIEMVVATAIMGVAVVGLLANISSSLRNASYLADYDRAALLGQEKMNELLLDSTWPEGSWIEGRFEGVDCGWKARRTLFEAPPDPRPGSPVLERIELQIRWGSEKRPRTLDLEGFRRALIPNPAVGL